MDRIVADLARMKRIREEIAAGQSRPEPVAVDSNQAYADRLIAEREREQARADQAEADLARYARALRKIKAETAKLRAPDFGTCVRTLQTIEGYAHDTLSGKKV